MKNNAISSVPSVPSVPACACADKNAARLEKMRRNLEKLENEAYAILAKSELTPFDRIRLLQLLNIAFHTSGKIETIASIDGTAACEFCEKMRNAANNNELVICGYCYAFADSWKEAAFRRHKLNALILSSVLFTEEELKTLFIPSVFCRINEDGDTVNAVHAQNILRIAKTHEFIRFGYWFKNVPAVAQALKNEGITSRSELPVNVVFVQSSLLIGIPAVPAWFSDCIFTVFPDKETTENAIACGAFECNGRKCKACGYNCYVHKRSENVQYIAEYLRTNAAKRASIVKAYNAYIASK